MRINSSNNSWVIEQTGNVFDQVSTSTKKVKTKDCQLIGEFPVIDQGQQPIAGFIDDEDKVIKVSEPLVIFGDHTRVIKWVGKDFVPGADGTKVLSSKAFLDHRFFYYQLRAIELPDKGYARHFKYLKESEFVIPPLAEQQQIAARLDALLSQVDALKNRLDSIPLVLKRFRQSVLAAAVSGRLTEEWREGYETQDAADLVEAVNQGKQGKLKVRLKKGWGEELDLFELPRNWSWTLNHKLAVDESTAICAGPFGTIFKAKDFREEGVPIIFLRHVKEAGFNQKKPNYMDKDVWAEYHRDYSVHGGELLVTKLGDPPGESCIYPTDQGIAMVTPDVLKMNVDLTVADTKYLMHFFNSPLTKDLIKKMAFGATRLRIDIAMFKGFPIPLPPREEQAEIVRCVEQLFTFADQIEKRIQDVQSRVNHLTQSILTKAFRGELTVDWREQNPDLISGSNAAGALLARVKADEDEMAKAKKSNPRRVKKKIGSSMVHKEIISVVEALEAANGPLSSQDLLAHAGYPLDASADQLEQFFLDLRGQLGAGSIKKDRKGDQDIFSVAI